MSKSDADHLFLPMTRQELVVFLYDTDSAGARPMFGDMRLTARLLGVQFQIVEVKSQNPDFEGTSCFSPRRVIVRRNGIEPHSKGRPATQ